MSRGEFAAAIGDAVDPTSLLRRIADRALELVPSADSVSIALVDDVGMRTVCGAGVGVSGVGTRAELGASLSGLAIETGRVVRSNDTSCDPRVDAVTCRRLAIASLVCVPLSRSYEMFGVLTVNSASPQAFTDVDVAVLTRVADIVSIAVGAACDLHRAGDQLRRLGHPAEGALSAVDGGRATGRYMTNALSPDAVARIDARLRVQRVLEDPEVLSLAFQPIIDLSSGAAVAVEALARFNVTPVRPPDMWFTDAHAADLGVDLEMVAVRRALDQIPLLPDGVAMSINVGPETMVSSQLAQAVAHVSPGRVVLELIEDKAFHAYPKLPAALLALRKRGVRVAVDDAGSGGSRPTRMLNLAPDLIKVDRELIFGIDLDPVRRSLVASLVRFASETGAEVLAEGVETRDELDAVRALGVRYGQGYFLGRPAPLDVLDLSRAVPLDPLEHHR
ncbi:MAG: EAL domain-containing protein [Acidimicrobiales bacterium]